MSESWGKCLGHLGRDASSLQAGNKEVSVAVKVGVQAVVVAMNLAEAQRG